MEAESRIGAPGKTAIFAADRDLGALCGLRQCLNAHGLSRTVALFAGDFFDLRPEKIPAAPGLVVLNPPYGRRLNAETDAGTFWKRMTARLVRAFGGWKVALVAPPTLLGNIPFAHRSRRLVHGGLKLNLVTGRIPQPG